LAGGNRFLEAIMRYVLAVGLAGLLLGSVAGDSADVKAGHNLSTYKRVKK
jgi:hypothetical protein